MPNKMKPSARHVVALHTCSPSATRVARGYLASWVPGEVRDNNWDEGQRAPTPEPESEGSQVPPARDDNGNELEA